MFSSVSRFSDTLLKFIGRRVFPLFFLTGVTGQEIIAANFPKLHFQAGFGLQPNRNSSRKISLFLFRRGTTQNQTIVLGYNS